MYADLANTFEVKCVVIIEAEGGFNQKSGVQLQLSDALANVVGGKRMSRFIIIKRIICYILEKKLQDSKNKLMIRCDDRLAKVFPTNMFRLTGMAKLLKKHISESRF